MNTRAQKQNQPQQKAAPNIKGSRAKQPATSHILSLQRRIGNQAVQQLLHANAEGPEVGADTFAATSFAETGRVAEQVMRMPESQQTDQEPQEHWNDGRKQLLAIQKKSLEISHPTDAGEKEADEAARKVVAGQSAEVHETVGTVNRRGEGSAETTPEFQSKLESSKGSGQPLDDATRIEMESKMGADFGGVKIHTNNEAQVLNESISAKAFTHGKNIYFRNGNYNLGSQPGKELLAHELAHTLQQGKDVERRIQREPVSQEPWGQDKTSKGKDLYFNTRGEAEARKAKLEKAGKWEEYVIGSSTKKGKTYWRVYMRGTRTMINFLTALRKAEKAYPSWTKEQMLNSLRRLAGYDTENFQKMYGTTAATNIEPVPASGFNETDIQQLRAMLSHEGSNEKETGIVKDFSGEYLAMGHVMTGISGGLHRNRQTDLVPWYGATAGEKMDNLYATTLSGDLGQSAVFVNENKQQGYVGAGTEATSAELVGDIDGVIIGEALAAANFKKTWDAAKTLSDFIEIFYKSELPKTRFSIASKFNEAYLKDQITRFAETYSYRDSKLSGVFSAVGAESEASYQAYKEWLSKKQIKKEKKLPAVPIKP